MSVVITTSLILELTDKDALRRILDFFDEKKSKNDEFEGVDVSGRPFCGAHYVISIKGDEHWNLWDYCLDDFIALFNLNYILVTYIEGDAFYFDIKLDDIKIDQLKLSPGRHKKTFWKILESENLLLNAKNWVLTKVNEKYGRDFQLIEIASDIPAIDEFEESEIKEIIASDNAAEFKKLMDKGMNLNRFIPLESIADKIILMNAMNIFKLVFTPDRFDSLVFRFNPLFSASLTGDFELLVSLLNLGANPNKRFHGCTILNDAVKRGNYEICKALLEIGKCDPNLRDEHSKNAPLSEASRQGRMDIVRLLLNYNVKKEIIKDSIVVACQNSNEETAFYLLNEISKKSKSVNFSDYPLDAIVYASENNIVSVIDFILELSIDVVNLSVRGRTALSMASKSGNLQLVKYLIKRGADPFCLDKKNYVSFDGKSLAIGDVKHNQFFIEPTHPLAEAAAHGHIDVVKYFVELGVDPRMAVLTTETSGSFGIKRFYFDQPAYEIAQFTGQEHVVSYLSKIEANLPKPRSKNNVKGEFYGCDLPKNCDCYAFEEAKCLITATWTQGTLSNPIRNEVYFHRQPATQDEIDAAIRAINKCHRCQLRYGGKDPMIIAKVHPRKSDYRLDENGEPIENI